MSNTDDSTLLAPDVTATAAVAAEVRRPGRLVFRNTLVNAIGGVAVLALNFVVIAFAINRLGSQAYGVWVLALSFSITAGYLSIADLGLQQGIVKYVADAEGVRDTERISRVVSSAIAVLAGLAVIAIVILLGLAVVAGHLFNIPDSLQSPFRLLFVLLAVEAGFGLPSLAFVGLLEGLQRYPLIRLVEFSRQVVTACLVFAVLLSGGGVVWFGVAMTAGSVIATAGFYVAAARALPGLRLSPRHVSLATLRPLAAFSMWIFLARINGVIWRQMDKIILAAVLVSTVLTGYEVAARIQGAAAFALAFTASAVVPATATLAAEGSTERLRDLLLRGTRYTMAVCLPITIAAMILAKPLIVGWVGPDYSDMAAATQLFLGYQLIVSAASIANTMLVGLGRVRSVTFYASVAVLVNLALSIILVHPWGVRGVIAGTLVGYGITAPLYIRLTLRELDLDLRRFMRESVLPIVPWAVIFAVIVEITRRVADPTHLVSTFAVCIPGLVVYVVGVAFVSTSAAERHRLAGFLRPSGGVAVKSLR
jgi:O-antigen/teichoic acid export membrane protein